MPTGYTAELVEKGEPFPKFAMRCARAFGALVMMRDDSMDAKVPDKFEPSDFYAKELAAARRKVDTLGAMTIQERAAYGFKRKADALLRLREWLDKDSAENQRLIEMRDKVESWTPPTKDHKGLKEFMLEQIQTSMNDLGYIKREITQTNERDPLSFFQEDLRAATENILRYVEENQKEIDRTNGRTEWVKALRASLPNS